MFRFDDLVQYGNERGREALLDAGGCYQIRLPSDLFYLVLTYQKKLAFTVEGRESWSFCLFIMALIFTPAETLIAVASVKHFCPQYVPCRFLIPTEKARW